MEAVDLFAKNMRAARRYLSLSQEELAHLSGLHRTYIGSVERCERNITLKNAERISRALGYSLPDFLKKDWEVHE